MNKKNGLISVLIYGGLAFWLIVASVPIIWTIVISFRDYVDAFSSPLKWVAPFTMKNYSRLWIDNLFYRNFFNTALVTVFVVTISLSVGCLAGYALSRPGLPFAPAIMVFFLAAIMVPGESLLIPTFLTVRESP